MSSADSPQARASHGNQQSAQLVGHPSLQALRKDNRRDDGRKSSPIVGPSSFITCGTDRARRLILVIAGSTGPLSQRGSLTRWMHSVTESGAPEAPSPMSRAPPDNLKPQ